MFSTTKSVKDVAREARSDEGVLGSVEARVEGGEEVVLGSVEARDEGDLGSEEVVEGVLGCVEARIKGRLGSGELRAEGELGSCKLRAVGELGSGEVAGEHVLGGTEEGELVAKRLRLSEISAMADETIQPWHDHLPVITCSM